MTTPETPTRAFSRGPNGERTMPVGTVATLIVSLATGLATGGFLGRGPSAEERAAERRADEERAAKTESALLELGRKADTVLLRLDALDRRAEAGDARAAEQARELRDLMQRVTRIEERAAAREANSPR